MKKLLVVMLSALLVLTACGSNGKNDGGDNKGSDLKIVTLLNGTLGDRSFFDSANEGTLRAAEEYGVTTRVVEVGYDATRWESSLADLVEEDWDIIITGTWGMSDLVHQYAKDYPEKKFIIFDAEFDFDDGTIENVYAMTYKQNEGSYLAGMLASLLTTSGEGNYNDSASIGFVGGNDTPIINDFLVGYIQGAVDANEDTKVNVSYVYDFSDTAKAKELSLAQYNSGIDIIFSVASTAGLGVIDAASEKGLYAVGVDADQGALFNETDPEKAKLIPSSMLKRVDNTIVTAIGRAIDGTLPWGTEEALGIKEEAVGLAKNDIYESTVPEDIRKKVEEAQEKILSGEIKVKTSIGMTQDEIKALIDSVRP